ncbi:MAG: DUF6716 putative glycosyltransferase [Bacteroidota bacterium]
MPEIVIISGGGSVHHARPLLGHFGDRAVVESDRLPASLLRHDPDLVITFDEHDCELGLLTGEMTRQGVATLQIMDGILEWRRTWQYPTSAQKRPLNQPVLAHKVACLGRADARIMESWGNVGKCEVIGSPRFDHLVKERREPRLTAVSGRPMRLLVMTAKTPGFTPEQVETTYRSLKDIRDALAGRGDVEILWRVTQNMHTRLGVHDTVRDVTGGELHEVLRKVDAVVTTSSTAMLEAMLCGRPTAVLDYHNCPHYVAAAWRITAASQIGPVVEELRTPPLERMLYQDYCLHDALSCSTPALPRMVRLIEGMIAIRKEWKSGGEATLRFPHRIVNEPEEHVAWPATPFDMEKLYPGHPVFGRSDLAAMQAELESALGTVERLHAQVELLTLRLHRIPGYTLAARIRKMLKR